MYQSINCKTTNRPSVSRLLLRRGLLLIPLVLTCLALSPAVEAVTPPPGGGYPGFNTALGDNALKVNDNTQGQFNTAIGFNALQANTTGDHNTAFGLNTLLFNTTGTGNMGIGGGCLRNNIAGSNNTAIGYQAMSANTASSGVAIGYQALLRNTNGTANTAIGFQALLSSTTGSSNTANGYQALYNNTTGVQNTAIGYQALVSNTVGSLNVANGLQSLFLNTSGNYNVADGVFALYNNTTGSRNVAIGLYAGSSLTTGSGNVCLGDEVLGVAGESNTTRIRNIYSSVASGRAVYVNGDNKIGTLASSRRYKEQIKPMDKASDATLALKPVTFRYKRELDPANCLAFGLIAEDVAEVNPDLVTFDVEGKPETVRYEAVNAMLLNEFLKEHRKVQEQQANMTQLNSKMANQAAIIAQQQKGMEALTAQLKEQASQIQKVSAQVELNQRAPRTVVNK